MAEITTPGPEDLRLRRARQGVTQTDMAGRLGVSQGTLAAWELGMNWPTLDKVKPMAAAYGVSTDDLIDALVAAKEARTP